MHKFKYTSRSSADGDKGITHILQYLTEPALPSAYLLSLVVLSAKEDAEDVILQIQLSQTISDGYFNAGENWHIKKYRSHRSPRGEQYTHFSHSICFFGVFCALFTHFSLSELVTSTGPTSN